METHTTSRKQTLITILQHLVGYRDLAEGFLILVQQSDNETFINELYNFIKKQIKAIKDQQQKKLINEQLRKIQRQKEMAYKVQEQEDQEAECLIEDLFLEEI
jgi:Na+-translocating ferredoxin:NAD+ oxidoreductase RnfG subunit